jgi:hypothetical protein
VPKVFFGINVDLNDSCAFVPAHLNVHQEVARSGNHLFGKGPNPIGDALLRGIHDLEWSRPVPKMN